MALLLGLMVPSKALLAETKIVPDPLYDRLDSRGVSMAYHAVQEALETGRSNKTLKWQDPESDSSGAVTPLRTFRIASGYYCRQFLEVVVTRDGKDVGTRTACRNEAGTWLKVLE